MSNIDEIMDIINREAEGSDGLEVRHASIRLHSLLGLCDDSFHFWWYWFWHGFCSVRIFA